MEGMAQGERAPAEAVPPSSPMATRRLIFHLNGRRAPHSGSRRPQAARESNNGRWQVDFKSRGGTTALGRAPVQRNGGGVSALASGCTRAGGRSTGVSKGVFDGWPVGLAALPGAQFCVWCHFPLSQPGSHAPQSSLQPDSIIATPKSGVANGPRRVERWVALLRGMFPPSAVAAHHCLLPPQRRTSTRGLTAGTRSRPPESRGGVRVLDSPLVDLDEAHHRGRRHRSRASASLRACFIPPCCRRGRSRLTAARGGGGRTAWGERRRRLRRGRGARWRRRSILHCNSRRPSSTCESARGASGAGAGRARARAQWQPWPRWSMPLKCSMKCHTNSESKVTIYSCV
jgi:hypothetical protein